MRRNREKKGKLIRKTELLRRERMEKQMCDTLWRKGGERDREENVEEEATGDKTKNKTSF